MQVYMKSVMPFHGVPMPEVRRVCRALYAGLQFDSFKPFEEQVLALWHGATHREERYAALALLRRGGTRFMTSQAIALNEALISTGAWWDLVDEVATHQLWPVLLSERAPMVKALRRWSRGGDLWLRRAAIIAQVGAKASTDVELLFELIEPALDERAFFLRKAIGWALRALGPWQPSAVVGWLDANADRASGLTRREALKGLAPARRRA
jgi:3-methyladenine DNA glycosylase AlkD